MIRFVKLSTMLISKKAVDFIVSKEVTSKTLYDKKYSGIIWPGGDSGATIGIGYDLGYQTPNSISSDWIVQVGSHQVDILKMFSGLKGNKAKDAILANPMTNAVNIPFQAAYNVFVKTSLVSYGRKMAAIYPGVDKLAPDAIGGLLSLIYNRGASLTGDRREEMRNIVPLITAKDYNGIADQVDAMKKLWKNGLVQRREEEAALIRNAVHQYSNDDLIDIG